MRVVLARSRTARKREAFCDGVSQCSQHAAHNSACSFARKNVQLVDEISHFDLTMHLQRAEYLRVPRSSLHILVSRVSPTYSDDGTWGQFAVLVGAPSTAAGNRDGEGRTVARSLSPDIFGDVRAAVSRPESVVNTLPGEMSIDLRTREIVVDLDSLDGRRAPRSVRFESESDTEPRTRIALGKTGNDRGKRVFDVVVVAITAPLWIPLLGLLAFAVKCTSRGPAFYAQERLGAGGLGFRGVKLRTMSAGADGDLETLLSSDPELRNEYDYRFKLRRDPRVTRFGRVLRRTGLDELPQLFAILQGQMSLVGPRPIVSRETVYYGPYLPLMQSVSPGLTGLWQVSGRNDIPYPLRVACDVQYVLTRSLWSDASLIAKTAVLVFHPARRGSY